MRYFLWIYFANILNRFRWLSICVAKLSLPILLILYLTLAFPTIPVYYGQVHSYIILMWIVYAVSLFLIFIPSEKFILNVLMLYRRDIFLRESFVAKIAKLIKYFIMQDILGKNYSEGIYRKLVNNKRIKWLCILIYFYDTYKGFAKAFRGFWLLTTVYFGFVFSTWLYVKITGINLYYYHVIETSVDIVYAIAAFLIFKILFIPSFSVIKKMIGQLIIQMLKYKFGISKLETKVDEKIASYEKAGENNV